MIDKKYSLSRKIFDEILKTKDIVNVVKKYPNFFGKGSTLEIIYRLEQDIKNYEYN